ncbi:DinB family protein [Hymenobacter terricola]|uniref:DinB family protein n=1 Tax=Hymenobacter terricola TaxID=2819236 RepID=UPI001B30D4A3|nr:DinB family protein [Hymenobacter terricola]
MEAQLALLAEHWERFTEEELLALSGPGRWCKKEVLGHLIDSAVNNYRRFVLAQIEAPPLKLIPYDQDAWVRAANYRQVPSADLLTLWTSANRLILHLLAQIPAPTLAIECFSLNNNPVTFRWLIDDYVLHLEHHVRQIIHEHE